jgi:hypothetical protein
MTVAIGPGKRDLAVDEKKLCYEKPCLMLINARKAQGACGDGSNPSGVDTNCINGTAAAGACTNGGTKT